MTVYSKIGKGGGDMDQNKVHGRQPAEDGLRPSFHRVVDWSEETIVVNGSPLTVIFPDEDKPLDASN